MALQNHLGYIQSVSTNLVARYKALEKRCLWYLSCPDSPTIKETNIEALPHQVKYKMDSRFLLSAHSFHFCIHPLAELQRNHCNHCHLVFPESPSALSTMNCRKCGHHNPTYNEVCERCGAELPTTAKAPQI